MTTDKLAQPAFRFPPSAFPHQPGGRRSLIPTQGTAQSGEEYRVFCQEYDEEYHVSSVDTLILLILFSPIQNRNEGSRGRGFEEPRGMRSVEPERGNEAAQRREENSSGRLETRRQPFLHS
jgi:hypothetical protein